MKMAKPFPEFVENLPELDLPIQGARGWMMQSDGQQVVFVEFAETVEVPAHSHSSQWEFALAGQVDLKLGGKTYTYTAGENFYIRPGIAHGATVHAGYKAMIVFDEPDRYKSKG
jgi:quercetin dioxygenase-like cupin family protein